MQYTFGKMIYLSSKAAQRVQRSSSEDAIASRLQRIFEDIEIVLVGLSCPWFRPSGQDTKDQSILWDIRVQRTYVCLYRYF